MSLETGEIYGSQAVHEGPKTKTHLILKHSKAYVLLLLHP